MGINKVFCLCFLFFSVSIFGQEFKGSIVYDLSADSKNPNVSRAAILKNIGSKSTFYYDNGSYIQVSQDGVLEFDYFDNRTKTYCLKYYDNDTLYIHDARKTKDKLIELKDLKNKVVVLDKDCSGIEITAENSLDNYKFRVYYSHEIVISGKLFQEINYGFMQDMYGKINSIPIYIEVEFPMFILKSTAIEIIHNDKLSVYSLIDSKIKGLIKNKIEVN